MPEETVNPTQEVTTTPASGTETEAATERAELEAMFKGGDAPEGESLEDKVARMEQEREDMKKNAHKFFSDKGRQAAEARKKAEEASKATPTQSQASSDDVTELFLKTEPNAQFIKDDLKQVADAKYNGSILKAWNNEKWLQDKAKAISVDEANKAKLNPPSSQPDTTPSFEAMDSLSDEEQAKVIKKLSDKEYKRYQEHLRSKDSRSRVLSL